jgi:hypothetical protein
MKHSLVNSPNESFSPFAQPNSGLLIIASSFFHRCSFYVSNAKPATA